MKKKPVEQRPDKFAAYKTAIKPVLTIWVWVMPVLSLRHADIAPFYIATVLSVLMSLVIWNHTRVRDWAAHYMHHFLYPLKKPVKLYDLAVQIFIFTMFIGLSLFIIIGVALFAKLTFM